MADRGVYDFFYFFHKIGCFTSVTLAVSRACMSQRGSGTSLGQKSISDLGFWNLVFLFRIHFCLSTFWLILAFRSRRLRLSVRTRGSQPRKRGSTPLGATTFQLPVVSYQLSVVGCQNRTIILPIAHCRSLIAYC